MHSKWVRLPLYKVLADPLYGSGGWLSLLLLINLLPPLTDAARLAFPGVEFYNLLLPVREDLPYLQAKLMVHAMVWTPVIVLYLRRRPVFRLASTVLLLPYPFELFFAAYAMLDRDAFLREAPLLAASTLCAMIFIVFLHQSRRVRITFEHLARSRSSDGLQRRAG